MNPLKWPDVYRLALLGALLIVLCAVLAAIAVRP